MKTLLTVFLLMPIASACPSMPQGDLNCDGRVDMADFAILAENWSREFEMPDTPEKLLITPSADASPRWPDGATPALADEPLNGQPAWATNYPPDYPIVSVYWNPAGDGVWELTAREIDGGLLSRWRREDASPLGEYAAYINATGSVTVSEYVTPEEAPPPDESDEVFVETGSLFDAAMVNIRGPVKSVFGKQIVLLPDGVTERRVTAIVDYDQVEKVPGLNHGSSRSIKITVDNNAVTGLSADEFVNGKSAVMVAEHVGGTPVKKPLTKILEQDAGTVTYQVR